MVVGKHSYCHPNRPLLRRVVFMGVLGVATAILAQSPSTQPSAPSTQPATSPSTAAPSTAPATRPIDPVKFAADRQRLADYLLQEYGKLAQSPDFVSRSIAAMLAARFPDPRANDFLLKMVETDKHAVPQLLAWEGLLSRSAWITADQHKRWIAATKQMARRDLFRGESRASLLKLLATAPGDQPSVAIATDVFIHTDSRRSEDDETLEALGRAIEVWKNRLLADQLMSRLGTGGGSEKRAIRALAAAGFALTPPSDDAPFTGMPPGVNGAPPRANPGSPAIAEMRNVVETWRKQRLAWKSDGVPADRAWLALESDVLPNLPAGATIDPYDNRWYKDLELGKPDLSNFDVAFVIDVSGSMGPAVNWVKREIGGMMTVLGLVAREPRIGVTFFGCRNDNFGVQPTPLTSDVRKLTNLLGQVKFTSGGEELVFDGLRDCIRSSRWSQGKKVAKVLVLVSDEPISPTQLPDCYALAKAAAENGYRIYGICPNRVQPTIAEVCGLGNGQAFEVQLQPSRQRLPAFRPPIPPTTQPATIPSTQPATTQPTTQPDGIDPPAPPVGNPAEFIVTTILSSAMRPEYRDRVEPMVSVIMSMNIPKEQEPEPRR